MGYRKIEKIKMCIVCSTGGHLLEAKLATRTLPYDRYYVTFYAPHLDHLRNSGNCYFVINPYRNILRFCINALQSLRIYLKERPNVIVTTGASVAIVTCLIGKVSGTKVIFVETAAAIKGPSMTGKLLYSIVDLFIVPWKSQLRYYKDALYVGEYLGGIP